MALTYNEKKIIKNAIATGLYSQIPEYIPIKDGDTVPEETKAKNDSIDDYVKTKIFSAVTNEQPFILTENDITDLDIFFKINGTNWKESFAHIVLNSASNAEPVFSMGREVMVGVAYGVSLFMGKMIINAMNDQIPLRKLCNVFGVSKVTQLPPLDLIITPKNKYEKYARQNSSAQIVGIKFKDYVLDEGTESPGNFFVLTYFAAECNPLNTSSKLVTALKCNNITNPFEYNFKLSEWEKYVDDLKTNSNLFPKTEWQELISRISSLEDESEKMNILSLMPTIYDRILTDMLSGG